LPHKQAQLAAIADKPARCFCKRSSVYLMTLLYNLYVIARTKKKVYDKDDLTICDHRL